MIKETLTAAKEALKSIPSLRYTAEDWGQLDSFNQPPVRFPCVLLDVEEIRYSDNGRGSQQGEASLTVRVADNRAVNAMFDLLQAVYKALQGLSGPGFSPLTRRHTVRVRREDGIREFRTSFDFAFTDNDAAAKRR